MPAPESAAVHPLVLLSIVDHYNRSARYAICCFVSPHFAVDAAICQANHIGNGQLIQDAFLSQRHKEESCRSSTGGDLQRGRASDK